MTRHPGDGNLLRFLSGETTGAETEIVQKHLEGCPECREELAGMRRTMADCEWYRSEVRAKLLPPLPAPWIDLYPEFARLDGVARRPRLPDWLRQPWFRPAASMGAALLLAAGLFIHFRETPSVQAAELLRQATAIADSRPQPRRLRIRTRDRQFVREAGRAQVAGLKPVQALFVAAHYDWNDPLSAKSFARWREQLSDKSDQVTESPGVFQVATSSSGNELSKATLTLASADLRPVEERFEFRDREWVEISAIADEPAASQPVTAAPVPTIAEPSSKALPDATSRPDAPSASVSEELQVVAALHRIGADLGDPIEVSREGSQVVVSGSGIAPGRRRQIEEAVNANPHAVVRWSDPGVVQPQKRAVPDNAAGGEATELQARVAAQVGGRANFEQMAARVFDLSEPMMSRAYALRRLAEEFPSDAQAQLDAEDAAVLAQLRRDHLRAMKQQVEELSRVLSPVLAGSTEAKPATLTPGAEALLQSARHTDQLLAVLFGASPSSVTAEQALADLRASVAELHARLELYGQLGTIPQRSQ